MDTLILLGAAGGLLRLLPVGDCEQGVTGRPGDPPRHISASRYCVLRQM